MKSTIRLSLIKMAVLFSLSLGLIFTSCSKKNSTPPVPTDKTSLNLAIDSAQFYVSATTEGTKPGDYTTGSKAALQAALASANAVLADPTSTQTVLNNAAANLQAAITAYKATFIQQIAAANLIAYWKFNGNANDSSGNSHNGTVTVGHAYFGAGMATLTNDRFGNANSAYHFDKGGNIDVPFDPAFNSQQMTISLWCRPDSTGRLAYNAGTATTETMISLERWYGWKFQFQPSRPFYTVRAYESAATPPDSAYYNYDAGVDLAVVGQAWYHVVVTFQPGTMNFYINGALAHSYTTGIAGTPVTLTTPVDLVIGQDLPTNQYSTVSTSNFYVNYGGYWSGDMDDVMFYNVALTSTQVASIYANQNTQ